MSGPDSLERREALFQRLAANRGGAAAILLDAEVIVAAQVKLGELKPLVVAEMRAAIGQIRQLAAARSTADRVFALAHDVRGLAGAYGFPGAGVVAGAIRAYGEHQRPGFEPDWGLLDLLSQMLARAFEHPAEASRKTLASTCREAVAKVMAREGRAMSEGAI